MNEKNPLYLTPTQVLEEYNLTRTFLEKHREIPRCKAGRKLLFKRTDIEAWLEERRQQGASNVRQLVNQIVEKVRRNQDGN